MRRFLFIPLVLAVCASAVSAADTDTAKAAATRTKITKTKISVEWKDALLRDIMDELHEKCPGVGIRADTKGGVVLNTKLSLSAKDGKDKTVAEILDLLCDKNATAELGWYVISQQNHAYEGSVWITKSKERGFEAGKEPKAEPKDPPKVDPKDPPKDPKDPKKDPPKVDPKDPKKDPPKVEPKDPPKDPPASADDDEATAERALKFAKSLLKDGLAAKARTKLEELVKKFPKTKAAEEAAEMLKKLNK